MSRKADFSLFSTFQHAYLEMDFFPSLFSTLPPSPHPGAGAALLAPGYYSLFSACIAGLPSSNKSAVQQGNEKAELTQMHNEAHLADHTMVPVGLYCLSSQARVGLIAFSSSLASL